MIRFSFDPQGKFETASAEELKALDRHTAIIAFTSGALPDSAPFYAYIAVRPSKYRDFYERTAAGIPLVLRDYGTVIRAGLAPQPPEAVVAYMRQEFGYRDSYEAELRQQFARQRDQGNAWTEGETPPDPSKTAH